MEPVTHFLTGACIGRAGFNRKTAYATLAAVLAAEAADIDILWEFAGPVKELAHHRGITHTLWAAPLVAGAVVGAIWIWHRVRRAHDGTADVAILLSSADTDEKGGTSSRSNSQDDRSFSSKNGRSGPQPVRWGWLYGAACVAAFTHLLLDWTNNYGVRPLFPLDTHWYAGSFMFIAEPLWWGLFFLAFFMPWVLGLADREIGARAQPFRGRGWAIFALIGMLVIGCWRWAEHAQAIAMLENTQIASEPATRVAAEPYPVNPFRWHGIVETSDFFRTAEIDTRTETIDSDPRRNVLYKPADTPAVEAAKRTLLGRVYLDWGTWAVVRDLGPEPIPAPVPGLDPPQLPPNRQWTTVEFTDLRFAYSFMATRSPGKAPLAGWVYIVDNRDDAGEAMEGRLQR
jgi:inner membrane protein